MNHDIKLKKHAKPCQIVKNYRTVKTRFIYKVAGRYCPAPPVFKFG